MNAKKIQNTNKEIGVKSIPKGIVVSVLAKGHVSEFLRQPSNMHTGPSIENQKKNKKTKTKHNHLPLKKDCIKKPASLSSHIE